MTDRYTQVAVFGSVYSNHVALSRAISDASERDADAILCLGDLGAFGPSPDKVFPLLHESSVHVVRGDYDDSIANGSSDWHCGYTDPRDDYYAELSYEYTLENTAPENRDFLAQLPTEFRFELGDLKVLCCHGSPRRLNEFLWESATPTHFLKKLTDDYNCDVILGTHTGIHWARQVGESQWYVNVGAVGRPENDGRSEVWYTILEASGKQLKVEFIPLSYDYQALIDEMRDERLPEEFVTTIRTGWWTTFLEVLPARERARGRF
jgi:predicted phosphodiesterase